MALGLSLKPFCLGFNMSSPTFTTIRLFELTWPSISQRLAFGDTCHGGIHLTGPRKVGAQSRAGLVRKINDGVPLGTFTGLLDGDAEVPARGPGRYALKGTVE